MELDKIIFKDLIDLLTNEYSLGLNPEFINIHKKIMNIITSIVIKYNNKTEWFLNKFLIFFLTDATNMYYYLSYGCVSMFNLTNNLKNSKYYCPSELYKILYIIEKLKLSEITKLFLENSRRKPKISVEDENLKKYKSLLDWFRQNEYLFNTNFGGITILAPLVIQDVKIVNNFANTKNIIEELVHIALKFNKFSVKIK